MYHNHIFKALTSVVEQEKEIANIRIEKKEIKLSLLVVNINCLQRKCTSDWNYSVLQGCLIGEHNTKVNCISEYKQQMVCIHDF